MTRRRRRTVAGDVMVTAVVGLLLSFEAILFDQTSLRQALLVVENN